MRLTPYRSKLSLEKDEFNFALILAHDLQILTTLESIKLTPQQRLDILGLCGRLIFSCIVLLRDLAEVERILGYDKASYLKKNAVQKAILETDLANS